jgi:hypothetical protein
MANDKKKEVKVRDLKPSKDAKGGGGHTNNAMGGNTNSMGGSTSGAAGNNKLQQQAGFGGKGGN